MANRFHVICLINQLSLQTFHQIDPDRKYQRGTLAALKTKPDTLTSLRQNKHTHYLEQLLGLIKELRGSGFQSLRTLGNTLFKWREEVVRMLRFTKNKGITEGFHRKMKLIQRRAYRFRNFENYSIRLRALCA